ncbi:MAG TPA: RNA polymerase sigma factor [Kofleriaceae bacterium]|nr:RNA polymerase sigma factor [Kofleriaceae bacterium]
MPPEDDDRNRSDDERVLDRLTRGDTRGAVELLMELHEAAVFAFCMRMLRDRAVAEDVAQQVFIAAYRDIGGFRREASLKTWLFGIARHRCGDAIKAGVRRDARFTLDDDAVTDSLDPAAPPADQLEHARLVAALEDCLEELDDKIRATVLLRFLSEMTYEEMAKVLDKKADTLCVRVARALPLLKRCLEHKGWRP